jgi:hypothetical protein
MSTWSNNNLAHVHTWLTLRVLNELPTTTTFDIAEQVQMNALAFWSDLDTPQQRATKAMTLAAQLDNFFRLIQGAQFELGIDAATAVQSLAGTLQDSARTLLDLAQVADDCYRFRNEVAT